MALRLGKTHFEPAPPLLDFTAPALEGAALRRCGGNCFSGALQIRLGLAEPRRRLPQSLFSRGEHRSVLCFSSRKRLSLCRQPRQRRLAFGELGLLAFAVTAEFGKPALCFAARGDRARQFLFESGSRLRQSLQLGRGLCFRQPQSRQRRLRFVAGMAFGVGALRGVGDGLLGGGQLDNAGFAFGLGGKPARIEQQRFMLPDLLAEPAIALRLPRLPFQSGELRAPSSPSRHRAASDSPPRR